MTGSWLIRSRDWIRRSIRETVPRPLYAFAANTYNGYRGARRMGIGPYRELRRLYPDRHAPSEELVAVSIPTLAHDVFVRPGTSDPDEVVHSCIRDAYSNYLPSGPIRFIIDAGANIGDTAVWYLSRFPQATVVSIEPDSRNFRVLHKNCSAYGSRAIPRQAGLWSSDEPLKVKWTGVASEIQVSVAAPGEIPDCQGITIRSILAQQKADQIDIFKCDIEGAETGVFSTDADHWLEKTRSIYIEIHGPAQSDAVRTATRRHGFREYIYRDLVIFVKGDASAHP